MIAAGKIGCFALFFGCTIVTQAFVADPKEEHYKLDKEQMRECGAVNHKASQLLLHEIHSRRSDIADITQKERILMSELALGSFGSSTLTHTEDVISKISLGHAIRSGVVWTLEDQQEFTQCNTKKSGYRLEEHLSIASGEKLVQGDMVELLSSDRGTQTWDTNVTYCFQERINTQAKKMFVEAVAHVTKQVPCLRFHEVAVDFANKYKCEGFSRAVLVTSDEPGCFSHVGCVNLGSHRSQQLNLGVGCEVMGMASHQLLHTLGMVHQTARSDRSEHVHFLRENVASAATADINFATNDEKWVGTPFDYMSIMNYSPFSFSKGGPTMLAKKDVRLSEFMGQRMGLSEIDVERVGMLYGCEKATAPVTTNKNLVMKMSEGKAYDIGDCKDEKYTGILVDGRLMTCPELADTHPNPCLAGDDELRIRKHCPASCLQCLPGFKEVVDTVNDKTEKESKAPVKDITFFR